ncbi:MAG: hypothetical protein EXR79_11150 [Myxococcales bacterium]|nr:hypothetical protein [Myxococcales bacterium]
MRGAVGAGGRIVEPHRESASIGPRRMSWGAAVLGSATAACVAAVVGCTAEPVAGDPDTVATFAFDGSGDLGLACPGQAGCACGSDSACKSGACAAAPGGKVCANSCNAGDACAAGFACNQVVLTDATGQPIGIAKVCLPKDNPNCRPCANAADCAGLGPTGGCVDVEGNEGRGGFFCAAACKETAQCAAGHICAPVLAVDGTKQGHCVPESRVCTCSAAAIAAAAATPCFVGLAPLPGTRAAPQCGGARSCSAAGLSTCSAKPAGAELCNGIDDDCDGAIDETKESDGKPTAAACADDVTCTADGCGGALGAVGCTHVPNAAACDDGNPCTLGDQCANLACLGQAKPCDDGNPCTDDACDTVKAGCVAKPNSAPCNDGEPCTAADVCAGAQCGGVPKDCDDGAACTTDTCKKAVGCDHGFAEQACDDGNLCTKDDECHLGQCVGDKADCDDGSPCTTDACDGKKGCVAVAVVDPNCGKASLPLVVPMACGATQNALWSLQHDGGPLAGSKAAPAVRWKVDKTPVDLAAAPTQCALNLNNGKDLVCGAAQTQVLATATSPQFDATDVASKTPIWLVFEHAGKWPAASVKAHVETSKDAGASWQVALVVAPPGSKAAPAPNANWEPVKVALAVAGKAFRVRLRFASVACDLVGASGWFVRNVATYADACASGAAGCHALATCSLGTNLAATCTCKAGWSGDGKVCADVDECQQKPSPCGALLCTNLPGSFKCGCGVGFEASGGQCQDTDECKASVPPCHPSALCTNAVGNFSCACKGGWSGDGKLCTDVDECKTGDSSCSPQATCTNTIGGFTCLCKPGYVGDGKTCGDVDECKTGNGGCHADAVCTNTPGGNTCACKPGYSGEGKACADVDECKTSNGGCHFTAICTNTPGANTCACKPGYAGNGKACTSQSAPSCAAVKAAVDPNAQSGKYTIDIDGPIGAKPAVVAYCDMATPGGPYTWLRYEGTALEGKQEPYAAACAQFGMEVVVPRSQAHANAIRAWNGGAVPNLVNVFPKTNGATGLNNWQGICKGVPCTFWLSSTNNANCEAFEPNGDNSTAYRLYSYATNKCDYGQWNDQVNSVLVTGWVICSTNDK